MAKQVSVYQLDQDETNVLNQVGDKSSLDTVMKRIAKHARSKRDRLAELGNIQYLGHDQLSELTEIVTELRDICARVPHVDDENGDDYALTDYKRALDMAVKQLESASGSQAAPGFPS